MHIYPHKTKRSALRSMLPILVVVAVMAVFIYGFSTIGGSTEAEHVAMVERAIRKALINCYAIEGAYPQKLAYLEEHYGLSLNHEKYVFMYDTLGSNTLPQVRVVPIGAGEHNPAQ